jgi:hypothetical protein
MKLPMLLVAAGIMVPVVGCGGFVLPGQENGAGTNKPIMSKVGAALTGDLDSKGYHLNGTQIKEEDIPVEIRNQVTLFHLVIQSEENPVLAASIKILDGNSGDCAVGTYGVPEGAPGMEIAWAEAGAAMPTTPGENDETRTNMPTVDTRPIICKEPKVLESFGKNETSNFISIVIKKSEKIFLVVEADGFSSKSMEIEGKKASFLVLNINLYRDWNGCTSPMPGGQGGGSSDVAIGAPTAVGAPDMMALQSMPDQCMVVEPGVAQVGSSGPVDETIVADSIKPDEI